MKSKSSSAMVAIAVTVGIGYLFAHVSIEVYGVYGSSIFILSPAICGAISVLIYNRAGKRQLTDSLVTALVTGLLSLLGFFVLGFEGLICLAMAAPIMIPKPEELLFRIGIAYPTHAEIKGEGVGAIRYCHFSTGSFIEPITHWEENSKLAFDVVEQPKPMTEISP